MDSRRVFVMVKNGKCGACQALEKSCWGTVDKPGELRKLVAQHFQLIEIHLPTWNDKIGPTYPHYLRNRIGYYPFIGIFSASSWQKALKEPNTDHMLEGEVYGAVLEKGVWKSTNSAPYTSDAIQEWAGLKPPSTNGAAPATAGSYSCKRRAMLKEMPK